MPELTPVVLRMHRVESSSSPAGCTGGELGAAQAACWAVQAERRLGPMSCLCHNGFRDTKGQHHTPTCTSSGSMPGPSQHRPDHAVTPASEPRDSVSNQF